MMTLLFKLACQGSQCMQNSARTFTSEQLVWSAKQSIFQLASVRNPDRNPNQCLLLLLELDAFSLKHHGPDENLGNSVLVQWMVASRVVACMMIGSRMGKAVMIQHNDSDTSCMRAYALFERTLASVAELFPWVFAIWQSCQPLLTL